MKEITDIRPPKKEDDFDFLTPEEQAELDRKEKLRKEKNELEEGNYLQAYEKLTLEELRARGDKFLRRKTKSEPQEMTPEAKAYHKALHWKEEAERKFGLSGLMDAVKGKYWQSRTPFVPYDIPYEHGKQVYTEIMRMELDKIGRALEIDEENKPIMRELVMYFMGIPEKLSLKKGIYLCGATGRGKTLIMKSASSFCRIIEERLRMADLEATKREFVFKNAKSIVVELADKKGEGGLGQYYKGNLCIDDIGAEDSYKLYGNELNVIADIIFERYQSFQNNNTITHATSNITPEEWAGKYGERVDSRLREMFNVVALVGTDKRLV